MSREKIKVPRKVYDELIALRQEIHFSIEHADTIKKAEDRGYLNAATWIRDNEKAWKVGFSWGFEPMGGEPSGTLRDVPAPEAPIKKRTITKPVQTMEPRNSKKGTGSQPGIFARFKNWLGKYF